MAIAKYVSPHKVPALLIYMSYFIYNKRYLNEKKHARVLLRNGNLKYQHFDHLEISGTNSSKTHLKISVVYLRDISFSYLISFSKISGANIFLGE